MQYGYYDGVSDIFNAADMQESRELVLERLLGSLDAVQEQADELEHELSHLLRKLEAIRESIDGNFGGE